MFLLAILPEVTTKPVLGHVCIYSLWDLAAMGGLFKLNWMPARAGCFDKAATVDAVKCCN